MNFPIYSRRTHILNPEQLKQYILKYTKHSIRLKSTANGNLIIVHNFSDNLAIQTHWQNIKLVDFQKLSEPIFLNEAINSKRIIFMNAKILNFSESTNVPSYQESQEFSKLYGKPNYITRAQYKLLEEHTDASAITDEMFDDLLISTRNYRLFLKYLNKR